MHLGGLEGQRATAGFTQVDRGAVVTHDLHESWRQNNALIAKNLDTAGLIERLGPGVGHTDAGGIVADDQTGLTDAGAGNNLNGGTAQDVVWLTGKERRQTTRHLEFTFADHKVGGEHL